MNLDNRRLQTIQLFKKARYEQLSNAESINESLIIQRKIDELEKEEKKIIQRCDAL